jgi:hypothetical protein
MATKTTSKPKLNLQPLELLDLGKCRTVSQIVDGMSRCAFGARMLGEVAAKLTAWCAEPTAISAWASTRTRPTGSNTARSAGPEAGAD